MGTRPHSGQSAPRLMRVDQKHTGQWSRTVTATRAAPSPGQAAEGGERVLGVDDVRVDAGCASRAKARGTARRLRPARRAAGARAGRPRSSGPGLVVSTVTSWPASRRARARARVDQPAPPARGG